MTTHNITIPRPPVTKKNSQRIVQIGPKCPICGKGKHPKPLPSEAFIRYQNDAGWFLKPLMIDTPVNVKALYYMKDHRKVDLGNLHAALHDVLVHYRVVKDDNASIIASTDGSRVLYDKDHPRTEIEIAEV